MSEQNPENILQFLTEIEEGIGRLYETYARNMPEHEEFWFGLVLGESDHSNLIRSLASKSGNGTASFTVDNAIPDKLNDFRELLKRETEKAGSENLSFTDALHVALDIEKYISDNDIYYLFGNPSGGHVDVVEKLNHDNTTRIRFLRKELERYDKRK